MQAPSDIPNRIRWDSKKPVGFGKEFILIPLLKDHPFLLSDNRSIVDGSLSVTENTNRKKDQK
jgi:hypothetical protein